MKFLSLLTLTAILSVSSCSMMNKGCCAKKSAAACTSEECKKACCDKDKKCTDGSCTDAKKKCDEAESCKKKS